MYSRPKLSSVIETSSRMRLKSLARSVNSRRINRDTWERWVISWDALNLATTLFKTCNTQEQNTIGWKCPLRVSTYGSQIKVSSLVNQIYKNVNFLCQVVKPKCFCFYIQSSWLNILELIRGCLYVCVCVCSVYSPNGSADFCENSHIYSLGCLSVRFF